jgi:molybdopterin-containing oxidoreductase family iron-sulfur binding subunit
MKPVDQCPSSAKEGKPGKQTLAREARELPRVAGAASSLRAWRGLEEVADTGEFRDWLEREFPAGASELDRAESEDAKENEGTTRRTFLKLMGASVALAGAATMPGCRRPNHKIMPYAAQVPEDIIPGKPLFYATAMPLPGGGAEGLLIETHEGRPTKVEGNPMHPLNRGKSTVWSQASVLNLYDPDRLKYPMFHGAPSGKPEATWDDFRDWAKRHFGQFDRTRGKGLAIVVDKKTSPTRDALRDRLKKRFPGAMFVAYEAIDRTGSLAQGTRLAFGAPMRELPTFSSNGQVTAKVVVSLDRDFLDQSDPACLSSSREFAATRRMLTTKDAMSRLYVVESGFSNTGSCADHRLRLSPSRIGAFAVLLGRLVLERAGGDVAGLKTALAGVQVAAGEDIPHDFVEAVADDLVAEAIEGGKRTRVGETLVLVGASQPAAIQAIGHAINAALGNIGKTVRYLPMSEELASDSAANLAGVCSAIDSGEVTSVVTIGVNPVYDAPAELDFAKRYAKVTSVNLSVESTETADASTWSLNGAHYLESWGDAESWDGTVSIIQPMIAPIFEPALSEIELLALIADPNAGILVGPADASEKKQATTAEAAGANTKNDVKTAPVVPAPAVAPVATRVDDGYGLVRGTWKGRLAKSDAEFDKAWRRALHDGVVAMNAPALQSPKAASNLGGEIAKLLLAPAPSKDELDVQFVTHHVHDGRFANNGWLHELPNVGTRVVWDNPALVSPKTAKDLGLLPAWYSERDPSTIYTHKYPEARIGKLTLAGRTIEIAVWILPGMADNTVLLPLGFGREHAGRVGDGVGFNAYPVRQITGMMASRAARLEPLNKEYMIASTQTHWSVDGRTAIVRQVDYPAWQKHGSDTPVEESDRLYATAKVLPFGERVGHGELTHTPPNINSYANPYSHSDDPYANKTPFPKNNGDYDGKTMAPALGSTYSKGSQWGMSIDLSTCTGCGACTIACQAENNIAIVGKKEVAKGREMSWIRVDRYFISDVSRQEFENPNEPVGMLHQPVACVHCENAPCEVVCPVNATVHGPEGNNYMVYNRCIGTRYCANNCPYKVRRFNFFDYGVKKFNGDYIGREQIEGIAPDRGGVTGSGEHNKINVNLIPPRLRQKLEEIERMQKNPNVTVRSRGVMEKCTYCIQRTNEARIEMKLHDIKNMPDGFVQTACQQACPSNAIVFGDILDTTSNGGKGSAVRQLREHQRSYMLLGYLNTRPRTTHMVRVTNPNPRLRTPIEDPFGHAGGHESEGGHEGGHEASGHGEKHAGGPRDAGRSLFLRDAAKRVADSGYALSLRVLGV